jgi:hypothetical protein
MNRLTLKDLWISASEGLSPEHPHLTATLAQLRGMITKGQAEYVSDFQMHNLKDAQPAVICPVSGQPSYPIRTLVTRDKSVFVEYSGSPHFWLVMSNLARGYPPSAIYYSDHDLLIKFDDPVWGVRVDQVSEFKQALAALGEATAYSNLVAVGDAVLVAGDQNFAHFMWNQLPALAELLKRPEFKTAKVVLTHEPLLPLEQLLPNLAASNILRISPYELLTEINKTGAVFYNPGSVKIPQSLIETIYQACRQVASETARRLSDAIDASHSPNIWISLRLHDRTARNQQYVVERLISRIFESYDNVNIILDGFSLPYDCDVNYDYASGLSDIAQKTHALAEEIIKNVYDALGPSQDKQIYNACGLRVYDSLFLAKHANFYFCHHGTVQHKVGWMSNCYGLVHSNRAVIDAKPEIWAASMIEDGVRPAYVGKEFIRDFDSGTEGNEQKRDLRLGNYVFVNLEALIDRIMVHMDRSIHKAYHH